MIPWINFAVLITSSFVFTVFVPVWYYFCVAEERDLLIRYGDAYNDYRATTGFWLPRKVGDESGPY